VTEQRVSGPDGVGAVPLATRSEAFSYADARDAQAATARIDSAPNGIVAFVGRCQKGPINEPIAIHSLADYQRVFGEAPGPVIGVGVLTDADALKLNLEAWYGDITLTPTSAA